MRSKSCPYGIHDAVALFPCVINVQRSTLTTGKVRIDACSTSCPSMARNTRESESGAIGRQLVIIFGGTGTASYISKQPPLHLPLLSSASLRLIKSILSHRSSHWDWASWPTLPTLPSCLSILDYWNAGPLHLTALIPFPSLSALHTTYNPPPTCS